MEVKLRPATTADETVFLDLVIGLCMFNRANREFGPLEEHLEDRVERNREALRTSSDQQLILLAEVDGQVLGYALCSCYGNLEGIGGSLDELYVKEGTRGLGLGRKLMHASLDWMKSKGVARATLSAYAFNQSALEFYEKEGFRTYSLSMERYI